MKEVFYKLSFAKIKYLKDNIIELNFIFYIFYNNLNISCILLNNYIYDVNIYKFINNLIYKNIYLSFYLFRRIKILNDNYMIILFLLFDKVCLNSYLKNYILRMEYIYKINRNNLFCIFCFKMLIYLKIMRYLNGK